MVDAQKEHGRRQCRAAQHPRTQYLVTADEHSLVTVQAMLATLPYCATGRVFIEVPDQSWIGTVTAPARMSVIWLDRSRRSGAPGTSRPCARGEALVRAVAAWSGEMLCTRDEITVHLLAGFASTADLHELLCTRYEVPTDRVHVPSEFAAHLR